MKIAMDGVRHSFHDILHGFDSPVHGLPNDILWNPSASRSIRAELWGLPRLICYSAPLCCFRSLFSFLSLDLDKDTDLTGPPLNDATSPPSHLYITQT